jgi:hypothetical protein
VKTTSAWGIETSWGSGRAGGGGRRPPSCAAGVDGEHDVEELGLTSWDLGPKGASLY